MFRPYLNEVPWDLTGGSAFLLMTNPIGASFIYTATIIGFGASVNWTVLAPIGTWLRAWKVTDAAGIIQISRPFVFTVISSPS